MSQYYWGLMSDYLDPNNEELLQDFYVEAEAQVELLESSILVLEDDSSNRDALDEIFRAAHTLKGASATVQMNEINQFTHLLEDVLDDVRAASSSVTRELVDVLLAAVDVIKAMLEARSNREVYENDGIASVAGRLRDCVAGAPRPPTEVATPASGDEEDGVPHRVPRGELLEAAGPDAGVVRAVRVSFDESNPMNSVGGIQVFAALKEIGTVLETDPDFDALYSDDFHPVVTYYVATEAEAQTIEETITLPDVTTGVTVSAVADEIPGPEAPDREEIDREEIAAGPEAGPAAPSTRRASTPSSSVLRVDSRRVDSLLNLVSEAVINKAALNQLEGEFADALGRFAAAEEGYRSSLRELFDAMPRYLERMQHGASAREVKREITERFGHLYRHFEQPGAAYRQSVARFRGIAQGLGRITGELQEGVMRIRMVAISQIFSRFPRLVRDLTRSLNKDVALRVEGEETELDKSVIEDLLDPLIHCVRNSIDHGIEPPDERVRHGKPETGDLLLRASREGSMIVIEVSDDGRGIDVDAVRRKAVDRGVIHPDKSLSDVEAYKLIFDPGFSTAREVSAISGRGVGLDVVRRQIEKLSGTVTVGSGLHRGTTFTIRIPLTLAIIQGLMVNVGQEMYAIPITSVLESQRIRSSEIRRLDNSEVLNVRDDVVSLLRLSRIFRVDTDEARENLFVVIVGSEDKKVGLVVDSLIGEEDVVIKPLRDRYTSAPGIAGANITGDGRVSLIIDVAQLLALGLKHERDVRRQREAVIGS